MFLATNMQLKARSQLQSTWPHSNQAPLNANDSLQNPEILSLKESEKESETVGSLTLVKEKSDVKAVPVIPMTPKLTTPDPPRQDQTLYSDCHSDDYFLQSLLQVARELSKDIADFAYGNRKLLAVISAIFLSSAPWIQVSRSRSLLLMVKPEVFLVAVVLGVILHLALFSLIPSLSLITGGSKSPFAMKENTSALLLVASQKTLPVMIAVVEQLGGALGASGLLVLPSVAAHLNQIIIDSFIVSLWKQKEGSFENAKIA